jgi:integrase
MTETRLPFTYVIGGKYWRFRRGALKAALPGKPGDAAFHARYAELLALSERKAPEPDRESFAWLVARYRKSAEFNALRPLTRLDYDKTLDLVVAELGEQPFALTTAPMIKRVRDDHAATPRKAHKLRQMLSRLYSWAGEEGLTENGHNPAAKIKRLKVRAKAITPWSEDEIARFMAAAPLWLQTPILLALYTGQRREDVVRMTWADYQGSIIRVRQSKTGEPLDIACHKVLRSHLSSIRTAFGGPIARNAKGKPFTANSLSQAIRRQVEAIDGFPHDRSIHGLRYAAAARLDEAGCTLTEAVAVLGHRTYQMAHRYMAQRRASEAAMARQEVRG